MILTQINHCTDLDIMYFPKQHFIALHRNRRLALSHINTVQESKEFHATYRIQLELKSVLPFTTANSAIRETCSSDSMFSSPLPSTHCFHAPRSSFSSIHQPFHFLHNIFSGATHLVLYLMQTIINRSSHLLQKYENAFMKMSQNSDPCSWKENRQFKKSARSTEVL